jgi:hypothetical protein
MAVALKDLKRHKPCTKCHVIKGLGEFYSNPQSGKPRSQCKACTKGYNNKKSRKRYDGGSAHYLHSDS